MSTPPHTEVLAPVAPAPLLGTHGEPCGSCAAPLAADQRYCLNCGVRRADARLPFRDILGTPAAPAVAPGTGAVATAAAPQQGRGGTIAALAGLGVTLLALGTGVVIGTSGQEASPAPAPQVVTVGGGTTPAAAATGGSDAAPGSASSKGGPGAAKNSAGARGTAGSAASSKAENPSLRKLDRLSPQQYQKQSQKLPKVVGTGGAPPPKDDKPAAGGGDFQTIG